MHFHQTLSPLEFTSAEPVSPHSGYSLARATKHTPRVSAAGYQRHDTYSIHYRRHEHISALPLS